MKETRQSRRKPSPAKKSDPIDLPPLVHAADGRYLTQLVEAAACDGRERRQFMGLLRRAYEDTMDLEVLYGELPGVLAGDLEAVEGFERLLESLVARGLPGHGSQADGRRAQRHEMSRLAALGGLGCEPDFFIRPDRIVSIAAGIERVARGHRERHRAFVGAVMSLWRGTRHLDRLNRVARASDPLGGRNRLAEHMRLLVRDGQRAAGASGRGQAPIGGEVPPVVGEVPGDPEGPPGEGLPEGGGGLWPPPDSGEDIPLPPDPGRPPGLDPDFCDEARELCEQLVEEGMLGAPLPTATFIDGILSVSAAACSGDWATITITGSGFGAAQPRDVVVLVDYLEADVVSWSDTEIVIRVPADTPSGCVGFRDETIEAERQRLHGQAQEAWEDLAVGLRCLGGVDLPIRLPYSSSRPPCGELNRFAGTLPEMVHFRVNGGHDIVITRGTPVTLSWRVDNAETIRIRRTSAEGPGLDVTDPPGNSWSLGSWFPPTPEVEATYELTATNACGVVSRDVRIRSRMRGALQILGVEAIQLIQRFDLADPAAGNDVRLVANKPTLLRVYLDPGLGDPLRQVTGRATIRPFGAAQSDPPLDVASPINPFTRPDGSVIEGFMTVPAGGSSRVTLESTLNFLLFPTMLSGHLEITVEAYVNGHRSDTLWGLHAEDRIDPTFHVRREQGIVQIRVQDDRLGLPPPSIAQFTDTMRGVETRLPIASGGLVTLLAPGNEILATDHDYTALTSRGTADGAPWEDLLDDVEDIAGDFDAPGAVWTALTTDDPRYNPIGGVAVIGKPHLAGRVGPPLILTHELLHTFGFGHAPCGGASGSDIDNRLPAATEDVGVEIATRQLVPAGTHEMMCRVQRPDRLSWMSIATWDIVFDLLA